MLDLSYFGCTGIFTTYYTGLSGMTNLKKLIYPVKQTSLGSNSSSVFADLVLMPEGLVDAGPMGGGRGTYVFPSTFAKCNDSNYSLIRYPKGNVTVICKAVVPPIATRRIIDYTSTTGKPTAIYVPDLSVDAYKTANGWSSHASIIKGLSEYPGEVPEYPLRTAIG